METSLFNRLKESMLQFNLPESLDIPLGQYIAANGDPTQFDPPPVYPSKTGPNYSLIAKWMVELEKLKPNTHSRWLAAGKLLQYMGYSVTWKGDAYPEVHWMNTEGNGADEAKMIDDIFNRDYLSEPRLDLSQLNGADAQAKMREILNCWDKPVIIDSATQVYTYQS